MYIYLSSLVSMMNVKLSVILILNNNLDGIKKCRVFMFVIFNFIVCIDIYNISTLGCKKITVCGVISILCGYQYYLLCLLTTFF